MRADEVREMSDADIIGRVAELEEERFRLKFRSATETLDEPLRFRTLRRDIARLKTVLRERQLSVRGDGAVAAAPAEGAATKKTGRSGRGGGQTSTAGAKRATRRGAAKE